MLGRYEVRLSKRPMMRKLDRSVLFFFVSPPRPLEGLLLDALYGATPQEPSLDIYMVTARNGADSMRP
jgi:hypothetical protein